MSLTVRKRSVVPTPHVLISIVAVFVLIAQPIYGFTSHYIASAAATAGPTILQPAEGSSYRTTDLPATQSWTAVPGATRYLYESYTTDPTVNPSQTPVHTEQRTVTHRIIGATALEGSYYWRVKAIAPTESQWSAVSTFSIDNTAPEAPVLTNSPVYVNASVPNAQATWSHSGADVAYYEYREYRNQTEADADTNGNTASYWIQTRLPGQLSQTVGQSWTGNKTLYYRVVAVDAAGNRSAPSTLGTVIIDKVAPAVSWQLQPVALYGKNAGFHVRPISPEAGLDKAVYIDTVAPENLVYQSVGEHKNLDTKNTNNQALWESLADGNHTFIAVFTDAAGNTTALSSNTFIIDRTAPTVAGSDESITYNPLQFMITAADANGISKTVGNIYRVNADGTSTLIKSSQTPADKLIVSLADLSSGKYFVRYNALDKAGNISLTKTYNFTVDNTKPSIWIKGAQWGNSYTPQSVGVGNTFKTVNLKLHDNDKVVRVVINETYEKEVTPGTWSDINDIQVGKNGGKYGLNTAVVYDAAGNSNEVTFILDNVGPTITIKNGTGALDGTIGSNPYSQISFKLYDQYSGLSSVSINGIDNSYSRSGTWNDLNWVNIVKSQLNQGTNTVFAKDVLGNETTLVFIYDNIAPQATFSYSHGNNLTNAEVITVTLTVNEPIITPEGWIAVDGSGTVFEKTFTDNGKYEVTLTDIAGNVSAPQPFEVKRIDRNAPTITLSQGESIVAPESTVEGVVTIVVFDPKWQGVDGFNKDTGLSITFNGLTTVVPTTEHIDKTYSVIVSEPGEYIVEATDKAGNKSGLVRFVILQPVVPVYETDALQQGSTIRQVTAPTYFAVSTLPADSQQDATEVLSETTDATTSSSQGEVLAVEDQKNAWSLVNAILAGITVLLGGIALAGLLRKRERGVNNHALVRTLTLVPLVAGALLFFTVENLSVPFTWFNGWTITFVIVAVVQVVLFTASRRTTTE